MTRLSPPPGFFVAQEPRGGLAAGQEWQHPFRHDTATPAEGTP